MGINFHDFITAPFHPKKTIKKMWELDPLGGGGLLKFPKMPPLEPLEDFGLGGIGTFQASSRRQWGIGQLGQGRKQPWWAAGYFKYGQDYTKLGG